MHVQSITSNRLYICSAFLSSCSLSWSPFRFCIVIFPTQVKWCLMDPCFRETGTFCYILGGGWYSWSVWNEIQLRWQAFAAVNIQRSCLRFGCLHWAEGMHSRSWWLCINWSWILHHVWFNDCGACAQWQLHGFTLEPNPNGGVLEASFSPDAQFVTAGTFPLLSRSV